MTHERDPKSPGTMLGKIMTWAMGLGFFGAVAYYGTAIAFVLFEPELTPFEKYTLQRERVEACYRFVDTVDPTIVTQAAPGFLGEEARSNGRQLVASEDYSLREYWSPREDGRMRMVTAFSHRASLDWIDTPYTRCTVRTWELTQDDGMGLGDAVWRDMRQRLANLSEVEERRFINSTNGVDNWDRRIVLCSDSGRPFRLSVEVEDDALERIAMVDFPDGFDAACGGAT